MPTVYRVRAVWAGFAGAPGYTNFSFADLTTDTARNAAGTAVKNFFGGFANYLLTTWSISVQSEVTEWDVATGVLTGATNMTSVPAATVGTGAAQPYAGGSGLCVTWKTGTIYSGRRIVGRTFMVPLAGCYDNDGTITAAVKTAAENAAAALIGAAGAEMGIWAKSWSEVTPPAKPVQIGGQFAPATSYVVKDMASQLRSRRI